MDVADFFQNSNVKEFLTGLVFLAPGFLIIFSRSRFVTGRISSVSAAAVEYVLVSSVYYAVSLPIFFWGNVVNWISIEILLFVAPIILGVFLGGLTQWDWPKIIPNFFKLNAITPFPTGWDKAFGSLKGDVWVIVTTLDSEKIYGKFSSESNASSLLDKRDIFIEDMCDEKFASLGEGNEKRGIWIREDQLVMIEIINTCEQ